MREVEVVEAVVEVGVGVEILNTEAAEEGEEVKVGEGDIESPIMLGERFSKGKRRR